jgi:hypothetical protein
MPPLFIWTMGSRGHKQRLDAVAASIIHKNDLTLSGLVANDEKCHWEPMQVGEWLGLIINTINFHFEISPRKIEKAKKNIESVLSSMCISYIENLLKFLVLLILYI